MSAEPRILIVVGLFFILLAIPTAMGAVSLGVLQTGPVPVNTPYPSGSYLVDSPLFAFLAVVFAGLGGYFLYSAGKLKGAR